MSNRPILYYTAFCPPCRAVLLTAAEIGIDLDLRIINILKREHRTLEFEQISPQRVLPTLNDNGTIVIDGHLICAYLADKYSSNQHLFPKEVHERNRVFSQLFFNCGHFGPRLRKVVEPVLWYGCTEIYPEAIQYLKKAYDGVEVLLKECPYVCGQHMTIADFLFIASISSANDFSAVDSAKYPNLVAWMKRMQKLPYYNQCDRQGADLLLDIMKTNLEQNRKAWE